MAEHLLARGTVGEHHREAATAGKESHCWKGKILLERGDTAGKENHCRKEEPLLERKGVRLPARRDCMEQRVGLFF